VEQKKGPMARARQAFGTVTWMRSQLWYVRGRILAAEAITG